MATRSAPTAMFTPDQLGLPGSVQSYGPVATPDTTAPSGTQVPRGALAESTPPWPPNRPRAWPWAVVVAVVLAVATAGALLLLRDRDPSPQVAVGALDVTATPDPAEPQAGPAPGERSTPAPTPSAGPTLAEVDPFPEPASPSVPVPVRPPADVGPGFLVTASDHRVPVPDPVLSQPALAWEAKLPGSVIEVVGDRELTVTSSRFGDGSSVSAHDVVTGMIRWTVSVDAELNPGDVTLTDIVIVIAGQGDQAELIGLDRSMGRGLWRQPVADNGELGIITLPDGRVALIDTDRLHVVDLATGLTQPIIDGGEVRLGRGVAAAYDGDVVRVVDITSGAPRFELSVGPLVADNSAWVVAQDRVVVYDGQTIWSVNTVGRREWDHNPTDDDHELRDLLLLPNDAILVSTAGTDGTVALDQTTGTVLWQTAGPVDVVGQFDGGLRAVDQTDSQLTLVDLTDGSIPGTVAAPAVPGTPVANGAYYVLTPEEVTAVSLADGSSLWTVPAMEATGRSAIPGGVVLHLPGDRIGLLR